MLNDVLLYACFHDAQHLATLSGQALNTLIVSPPFLDLFPTSLQPALSFSVGLGVSFQKFLSLLVLALLCLFQFVSIFLLPLHLVF